MIKNKRSFLFGLVLAISFFVVLILIFSPLFNGKNGLEYSDDMFNKLAKGSSYFIPELTEKNEKFMDHKFSVSLTLGKLDQVDKAAKVLKTAGAQVEVSEATLKINGTLGVVLSKALADSDAMYKNDGQKVAQLYGLNELEVMTAWWNVLSGLSKIFQKEKKVKELDIVTLVNRKGVEPAFNFYGIQGQRVIDRAGTMTGLLVFYVIYTMWWGYGVFMIFDGLGLSMKKARIKKEA